MRLGKIPDRDGQRADVVEMAVRERDGVHLLPGDGVVKRQAGFAVVTRMGAGVHEEFVPLDFDEPGAGADVGIWIETGDAHSWKSI